MRGPAAVAALALVACVRRADVGAQTALSGWKLVVRIVPNPLPAGRCAGISVEVQDDEGYRRTELSNGQAIDFRRFRYDADTTLFKWRDGKPVDAYICAPEKTLAGRTTVSVTLPDGLTGTVELTTFEPGRSAAPVQYAPQGRLRPAGATRIASRAIPTVADAPLAPVVTTDPLRLTGAYFSLSPITVDAPALALTGGYFALPPITVDAPALTLTGGYFTLPPIIVDAPALSLTGTDAPARIVAPGRTTVPSRIPPPANEVLP